jgi:hypothetical protein
MRPAGPKRKPRTGRGSPEHALTHSFDSSAANSVQIAGPKGSDRKSGRRWCGRRQDQLLHLLGVQKPKCEAEVKAGPEGRLRTTGENTRRQHKNRHSWVGATHKKKALSKALLGQKENRRTVRHVQNPVRHPECGGRRTLVKCPTNEEVASSICESEYKPEIGAAEGATQSRHCLRFPEAPRYNEQELITGEP